jgi:hypothetical protein
MATGLTGGYGPAHAGNRGNAQSLATSACARAAALFSSRPLA